MHNHKATQQDPIKAFDEAEKASLQTEETLVYVLYLRAIYRQYSLEKSDITRNLIKKDLDLIALIAERNVGVKNYIKINLEGAPNFKRDFSEISPGIRALVQ